MADKPHYVLNIQNGRHIAAQKLALPKAPAQPEVKATPAQPDWTSVAAAAALAAALAAAPATDE